jgi:hypothetical protein
VKRDTRLSPVRDILDSILSHNERLRYEIKVREAIQRWGEVAGDFGKDSTKAIHAKNRTLYVNTQSSALANELSLHENEYIKKLNSVLGAAVIKKIVFKTGDTVFERKKSRPSAHVSGRLPLNAVKKIDDAVSHIREGDLQDAFRRFLRTTALRNKNRRTGR